MRAGTVSAITSVYMSGTVLGYQWWNWPYTLDLTNMLILQMRKLGPERYSDLSTFTQLTERLKLANLKMEVDRHYKWHWGCEITGDQVSLQTGEGTGKGWETQGQSKTPHWHSDRRYPPRHQEDKHLCGFVAMVTFMLVSSYCPILWS